MASSVHWIVYYSDPICSSLTNQVFVYARILFDLYQCISAHASFTDVSAKLILKLKFAYYNRDDSNQKLLPGGTASVRYCKRWKFGMILVWQIWWTEEIYQTLIPQLATFVLSCIVNSPNFFLPSCFERQFAIHYPLQTFATYGYKALTSKQTVRPKMSMPSLCSPAPTQIGLWLGLNVIYIYI